MKQTLFFVIEGIQQFLINIKVNIYFNNSKTAERTKNKVLSAVLLLLCLWLLRLLRLRLWALNLLLLGLCLLDLWLLCTLLQGVLRMKVLAGLKEISACLRLGRDKARMFIKNEDTPVRISGNKYTVIKETLLKWYQVYLERQQ